MAAFFATGHPVDIVLGVMMLEALYLIRARRQPAWPVMLAIMPGALILLALRATIAGAEWWWVALALAASFPFHLADLRQRGW